jgi:hypothetical protein
MRVAVAAACLFLSACVTDKLSVVPPAGVNFTGQWQLNVAESDDPQHLLETANSQESAASKDPGASGGRGGRGGGRGSAAGYPAAVPPATPAMSVVGEALSWPGKKLDIKQVAGVVAFTSDGNNRVCQPTDSEKKGRHHGGSSDRDGRPSGRDVPPPICGWSDKTLIVQGGDPDDDRPPYEERYGISEDGQRLVEVVAFKGGRSNGFTMSRVWDRLPQ